MREGRSRCKRSQAFWRDENGETNRRNGRRNMTRGGTKENTKNRQERSKWEGGYLWEKIYNHGRTWTRKETER